MEVASDLALGLVYFLAGYGARDIVDYYLKHKKRVVNNNDP